MKKINSIDYLRNVIKNWRSFCKEHRPFVQAIDDVLKLVNYQQAEIERLRDRYEAVDKFRDALMDEFLRLCNYNDFSKLNLEKIADTVNETYYKCENGWRYCEMNMEKARYRLQVAYELIANIHSQLCNSTTRDDDIIEYTQGILRQILILDDKLKKR